MFGESGGLQGDKLAGQIRRMKPLAEILKPFSHVLLTGGSSGIGNAIITTILDASTDLEICNISRTAPAQFGADPRIVHKAGDLGDRLARRALLQQAQAWLEGANGRILVVNNAGYGGYGDFAERDIDDDLGMIELNCAALVEITHRLLPLLRRRGGAVLNIASTAAWQPTPYLATYGATKTFVLQWSRALHEELKGSPVQVTAICPGPTESRFFARAGFDQPPLTGKGQSAAAVAVFCIRQLDRGGAYAISGAWNRVMVILSRNLPCRIQGTVAAAVLRRVRRPSRPVSL